MQQIPDMKRLLSLLTLLSVSLFVLAGEGDTTVVRSHNKQHMKFPPSDRNYVSRVKFPDGSQTYRKILLSYTLGCPGTGCSTWDYDTHVSILVPTGTYDSTLVEYPFFKVDNAAPDSFYISLNPTYQTFYDAVNKRTDSLISDTVLVEEFSDYNNPTTVTNSFYAYETGYYKKYYDTTGLQVDSVFVMGDSLWHQGYHQHYNVFEIKNTVELARLITPYGDNSNVGYYPYTYDFDVTDYAPILKDSMDILLRFAGWQDGFLATIDFKFIEGTPPRLPKRVIHLYDGYYAYGNASNPINARLTAYPLQLASDETYAQLNYTVTGHGADNFGCSEFCAREYYVLIDGSTRYTQLVWDEDCGMNPIYPQGGTWIYDRANWCPGLPGYRYEHELTPYVSQSASKQIKVDFQSHTASGGSPGYSISGTIITYGAAAQSLDAEVVKIIAPNNEMLEGRFNPICGKPRIVIRNTGSTTLTSLNITYGPQGGTPSVFNWTGNLKFLESEEVELDAPNWARSANVFEVTVSAPNGGTDGYASNNTLSSTFNAPDLMPNQFRIMYKTNNRSNQENKLTITSLDGQVVYSRIKPQNDFAYTDTLELEDGCYIMKLTDSGEDGLEFWAGSQTVGYLRFHQYSSLALIKKFEPDFGSEINYQFTVGRPLGESQIPQAEPDILIYPNPSQGSFYLEGLDFAKSLSVQVFDQVGREIPAATQLDQGFRLMITPRAEPGLYTVRVTQGSQVVTRRIILQ